MWTYNAKLSLSLQWVSVAPQEHFTQKNAFTGSSSEYSASAVCRADYLFSATKIQTKYFDFSVFYLIIKIFMIRAFWWHLIGLLIPSGCWDTSIWKWLVWESMWSPRNGLKFCTSFNGQTIQNCIYKLVMNIYLLIYEFWEYNIKYFMTSSEPLYINIY